MNNITSFFKIIINRIVAFLKSYTHMWRSGQHDIVSYVTSDTNKFNRVEHISCVQCRLIFYKHPNYSLAEVHNDMDWYKDAVNKKQWIYNRE